MVVTILLDFPRMTIRYTIHATDDETILLSLQSMCYALIDNGCSVALIEVECNGCSEFVELYELFQCDRR